jgi:hypothetical protein
MSCASSEPAERTRRQLQALEERHGMTSREFIERYERDELPETLEFAEWIGEYRLLERLTDRAHALEE